MRWGALRRLIVWAVLPLAALLVVPATPRPTVAQAEVQTVEIFDFGFRPAEISIAVGTTVEWVNTGVATHTSTSDTGVWDSGPLAGRSAGRFRFTFTQSGTFHYHCEPHPFMRGTIIVEGPASTPTPTPQASPTPPPAPMPTATPPPGDRVVARIFLPAVFHGSPR